MDLSKVVKIGLIAGISIIAIIATTNMLFPSNAINLHEQACMSLANQMIENMEESNFDTEKFAKMNDLLFSRCLLYTSPSPRDGLLSRMPSSA